MSLTPKQQRFVSEYLLDLNAAAAYTRAGYTAKSPKVAAANAARLIAKDSIASAISEASRSRNVRTELTQDEVINGLRVEANDREAGASHAARVRAWELLGKHRGMFLDKMELSADGILVKALMGMSDAELRATADRAAANGSGQRPGEDHPQSAGEE